MTAALITRVPGPGSTPNWTAVMVVAGVTLLLVLVCVGLLYKSWQPRPAAAHALAKRLDRAEEVLVYTGAGCALLAGACALLGYETPGVVLASLALMIVGVAVAAAVAESLTLRKVNR